MFIIQILNVYDVYIMYMYIMHSYDNNPQYDMYT